MRCHRYIFLLSIGIATFGGCSRGPVLSQKLQAAGGSAMLRQECLGFVEVYEESSGRKYVWFPRDTSFPPAMAALQPQAVSITSQDDVVMVDVQLSGGFAHHGLLVAPTNHAADFEPTRGNWNMWRLAEGVWEYRE